MRRPNGAAEGEAPIVLMARAGHKSMATTQRYIDLAGVTFPDEAEALEARMLGGRKFYPTEPTSSDLASPETAQTGGSETPPA